MGDMNDVLTEVRFWSLVLYNERQTVFCSPDLESRIKGYVAARGMDGLITVIASPGVPDDRVYVSNDAQCETLLNRPLGRP